MQRDKTPASARSGAAAPRGAAPLGERPLKVVVAGAGSISPYHLTGWQQVVDAEIVAVCDPDLERARARAVTFSIQRAYTDFTTMLDRERPDAVDILTPVATHAPLVRLAADRGVHVMCQKPMTPALAEAEALVREVGERVRFMVHENFRFRSHYLAVAEGLRGGRVGEPRQVHLSVRGSGLLPQGGEPAVLLARQPYLKTFRRLLIFEVLIHHLDVLRCLLGPLRVVGAEVARVNPELAGEDAAAILFRGEGGLMVVLDGHLCAPGYPARAVDRLEIVGSAGTLLFDMDRLHWVGSDEPAIFFDLERNYQSCFTAAIQHFVRGLRTGAPFATDRLDNLETLRLMEACYAAAGIPA
jgi:D-apiose dehydrogenase